MEVAATAGDRYALAGALIESSLVNAPRGAAAHEEWAPRHGFHATPGLVHFVSSDDAETRKLGLWTLASLPFTKADPRIVAVVKALSSDPDADVRRAAVESAQFTVDPGDAPVLAALADRMLVDEDFSVRRAAAEGIRKLVLDRHTFLGNACRVLEPHLPQVFDIILRCWATRRRDGHAVADTNIDTIHFTADELVASVRTAGLGVSEKETRGIFGLAPSKHRLLKCAELASAVAETAARERLPAFVLEALIRTLMDANVSVRTEALRAVKYVTEPGDERASRMLIEHVEKGLGAVRSEVLEALTATARAGDLRVTMALAAATEDARAPIRTVALDLLSRHVDLTDASAREIASHAAAARSMREETDTGVRKAALRLLGSLNQGGGNRAPGADTRGGGGGGGRGTWISQSRRDSVEERLESTDVQERYMAAREAGILAESAETPQRRAILLEKVIHCLRIDADPAVRRAAIESTAKLVQRALKDPQRGTTGLMQTSTSPSKRAAAAVADAQVMVEMVIKVLLERMRKETVEDTRLTCVKMVRELATPGDVLVVSILADCVCSDESVQIRKTIMLAIGELMGHADGSVDLGLAEQLELHEMLRQRSENVEESVATRKLAKALLHRLEIAAPPKTATSEDS